MTRPWALLGWVGGLALAALVLAEATPALMQRAASAGAGPDAVVAAGAAAAAWCVLAWLSLGVAACLAEVLGVPVAHRAAALAPRALRVAVGTGVGVGLVAGSWTLAGPVQADVPTPHAVLGAATSGDRSDRPWPSLDRPAEPARASAPSVATYRVRPGDTLWSIAEANLPRTATSADVAREWPRWWRANRTAIGADPDLIHPGQLLRAPGGRA